VAPLPFSDPGARIAFDVLLVVWVLGELWIRVRTRRNRRESRPVDQGSMLLVIALVAAGVGGAFLLAGDVHGAAIAHARWVLFALGLVLMGGGIAIRQWAVAVLGRFFTIDVRVQPGQAVVDSGPYRWVRHPSYTGLILTFVGIGLALGNWAALALVTVVPTVGLLVRIRVEERALVEGLGEPYRRFAANRPRLFPGIW